jgi:MoxR-like ATPase
MRIALGYPDESEENAILERFRVDNPLEDLLPVTDPDEVVKLITERRQVRVAQAVREYIVHVVRATRQNEDIELGASPRATLSLYQASQAWAAIHGRDYVLPDDVKYLAPHVLTHRLMLSPQAQLRGRRMEELVADIVEMVPVPVEN